MEINIEKAVKAGVEQAMRECELTIGMTLKEAVEKQVPKEPKDDGWLYCPVCGRDVLMDRFKYCPDCGQRIDWESVENQ